MPQRATCDSSHSGLVTHAISAFGGIVTKVWLVMAKRWDSDVGECNLANPILCVSDPADVARA